MCMGYTKVYFCIYGYTVSYKGLVEHPQILAIWHMR